MSIETYLFWPALDVMVRGTVEERRHEPIDWVSHDREVFARPIVSLQRTAKKGVKTEQRHQEDVSDDL